MFSKIVNINHTITEFATIVSNTCVIMSPISDNNWTTFAEFTLKNLMDPTKFVDPSMWKSTRGRGSMDNHIITKFATAVPYA